MYCKQKKVSVKVSHDSKQIMSAQYDRMAVIELLKAVLLYEKLNPDFEIELSGELLEPNTLFTCWKKHTSHMSFQTKPKVMQQASALCSGRLQGQNTSWRFQER
jgi:hypothetical protein